MSLEEVINKYVEAANSCPFISYEKDFSEKIEFALSKGYKQGLDEPSLVKSVESIINNVNGLKDKKY